MIADWKEGWKQIPQSIESEIFHLRSNPALYYLGALIGLYHLLINSLINIDSNIQNITHFASFVILAGLVYPSPILKKIKLAWLDAIFILLIAISSLFLIISENQIYERGVKLETIDWITGLIIIVGAIELVRRTTGWIIPIIITLALTYIVWWGAYVPGVFRFSGLKLETALFRSLFGDDALFGSISRISSTFVFIFIIFGAFLLRSGAGNFVIELSDLIARKIVGGPAIIAILASGLTGTISGSAIANTASTGVVTIPMMKRAGFHPRFAAGVEAAASTGGQLMPPIMGAGAFVMASYTQIPYSIIVMVSFLPALLYFIVLAFYVRIETYKSGLVEKLSKNQEQTEPVKIFQLIFQKGPAFILPISLLIILLILGFTPIYAGVFSIFAVIIASWITPIKLGVRGIIDALALGSRNMIVTSILLCSVGLLINVISTAGIGNTFSLMIVEWSGNSILIAILLIAIASLILGMGLPVTAAYIVLATLSAPALYNLMVKAEIAEILLASPLTQEVKNILSLSFPEILTHEGILTVATVNKIMDTIPVELMSLIQPLLINENHLGLVLLSAHMIIFWLSQDSNVTPPVCLCSFTAAAIAKTPPMATGFTSWKVAKGLYVIPMLFAYTPLITGTFWQAIPIFFFALFGLYAFSCFIQGWNNKKLNLGERTFMGGFALSLLYPLSIPVELVITVIFLVFLYYLNHKKPSV